MSKCNSCMWSNNGFCVKFNTVTGNVSFCMQYDKKGA